MAYVMSPDVLAAIGSLPARHHHDDAHHACQADDRDQGHRGKKEKKNRSKQTNKAEAKKKKHKKNKKKKDDTPKVWPEFSRRQPSVSNSTQATAHANLYRGVFPVLIHMIVV